MRDLKELPLEITRRIQKYWKRGEGERKGGARKGICSPKHVFFGVFLRNGSKTTDEWGGGWCLVPPLQCSN